MSLKICCKNVIDISFLFKNNRHSSKFQTISFFDFLSFRCRNDNTTNYKLWLENSFKFFPFFYDQIALAKFRLDDWMCPFFFFFWRRWLHSRCRKQRISSFTRKILRTQKKRRLGLIEVKCKTFSIIWIFISLIVIL